MTKLEWLSMALVVVTGALVIVTAVYVFFTARLARESRAQTLALMRPYVLVDFGVTPDGAVSLRIENVGKAVAQGVTVLLDRPVPRHDGKLLNDFTLFKTGIASLAQGSELHFFLGAAHQLLSEESSFPRRFKVATTYRFGQTSFRESTELDFKAYEGALVPSHDDVTKELQKIAKNLEKLGGQR